MNYLKLLIPLMKKISLDPNTFQNHFHSPRPKKKKNGFEASSDLALLVVCYAQGRGVAQDMQKAKELYNRAIAACDNCYLHGPYGVLDDSLVKEQKEHVYGILAEFGIDTTVFAE